jgi:hypothetical protein
MSQQTNAGFNAPGFSVVADDPDSAMPCAAKSGELPRSTSRRAPSGDRIDLSALAVGVGHSAAGVFCAIQYTCLGSRSSRLAPSFLGAKLMPMLSLWSRVVGVGHKPQAVASMRGVDGTSRDNGRPAGVSDAFQVSEHSVEPVLANRRRNLLSHEDSGPSGTGEAKKVGPQVPIVSLGFALAGDRERLARGRAGPQLAVVGPSSKSGCERPSADAGEEVALDVAGQIGGLDIDNASFIYVTFGDQPRVNEIAQPLRCVGVEFVVVGGHVASFNSRIARRDSSPNALHSSRLAFSSGAADSISARRFAT